MPPIGLPAKVTPKDPAWKTFENDVADFVAALDGSAVVERDVRRTGVLSARQRQIDVLVTGTVGDSKIEIAIECKRNTTKTLGIKVVDEFVGKVLDVGADRGVLCAFGGFDAGAKARAKGAKHPKIELRDLSDWDLDLHAPWADIADDFVRADCPNTTCWGEITWGDYSDEDGKAVKVGTCDSCGSLIGECSVCGERTSLDFDTVQCDGCEAEWSVMWSGNDHDGIDCVNLVGPVEHAP